MNDAHIIGKKIIEIYETETSKGEDLFGLGFAHYFSIVIEFEDKTRFELGVHDITPWQSNERMTPSKGSSWAEEHNLQYKGKKIKKIIRRDPQEYYDGSLTLVLENDILLEHQCCNGDQLFIDKFKQDPD